jgi:hypothetical protein
VNYCDFFQKVGTLKNSNQIQILFGSGFFNSISICNLNWCPRGKLSLIIYSTTLEFLEFGKGSFAI